MNEDDKRAIDDYYYYQSRWYVLRLSYGASPHSYHLIYLFLSSLLSAIHYLESEFLSPESHQFNFGVLYIRNVVVDLVVRLCSKPSAILLFLFCSLSLRLLFSSSSASFIS